MSSDIRRLLACGESSGLTANPTSRAKCSVILVIRRPVPAPLFRLQVLKRRLAARAHDENADRVKITALIRDRDDTRRPSTSKVCMQYLWQLASVWRSPRKSP